MLTVNMHDAKTRLSELVARAVKGEPFIIAKAGKPMVKVVPIDAPAQGSAQRRFGFAKDLWEAPSDELWAELDREVRALFEDEAARDGGVASAHDPKR